MKHVNGEWIRQWILLAADEFQLRREELNELDSQISDGDHGDNLVRGFRAARSAVTRTDTVLPSRILGYVGLTFLSAVSGSSGPMLSSTFVCMAEAAAALEGDDGSLDAEAIAALVVAGARGVKRRGRAGLGSKTMADAWIPAGQAAEDVAVRGGNCMEVLTAAAAAAAQGAQATRQLPADQGRARFRGARAIGFVDAGARSSAYFLECGVRALREMCDGGNGVEPSGEQQ